jgi:hypothetical protein
LYAESKSVVPAGEVRDTTKVCGWLLVIFIHKELIEQPQPIPGGSSVHQEETLAVKVLVSHMGIGPLVKYCAWENLNVPIKINAVHRVMCSSVFMAGDLAFIPGCGFVLNEDNEKKTSGLQVSCKKDQ